MRGNIIRGRSVARGFRAIRWNTGKINRDLRDIGYHMLLERNDVGIFKARATSGATHQFCRARCEPKLIVFVHPI